MKSILILAALALALAAFRELNVRHRRERSMVDIARQTNPLLRSWIEYYGRYALSALSPLLRYVNQTLRACVMRKFQAGFLAASLRDRAKPDDNARHLAQWQAEGRVVIEKSAHRHTWIASITGSCTILCSAPASALLRASGKGCKRAWNCHSITARKSVCRIASIRSRLA